MPVVLQSAKASKRSMAQKYFTSLYKVNIKQNGISVEVFDKEPATGRVRDWGMAYFWGSEYISNLLPESVLNDLPRAEVDYGLTTPTGAVHEYLTIRNTSNGDVMKIIPTPGGRRVSRKRLRDVLRTGLDVHYDKNIVEIFYLDSGVMVQFQVSFVLSGNIKELETRL